VVVARDSETEWRRGESTADEQGTEAKQWKSKTGGWRERELEKENSWRPRREVEENEENEIQKNSEREGPKERDSNIDKDFHDLKGPHQEKDEFRGLHRERDIDLGLARVDKDFRGPSRDDFRGIPRNDVRSTPRDDRDFRGSPRDRNDFRGQPREDRDLKAPRDSGRDRDFRAPADERERNLRDIRDRAPPRNDDRSPRDERGPLNRDDWRSGRADDKERQRPDGDNWRSAPRDSGFSESWRDRRDERGAPPARDDWRGGDRSKDVAQSRVGAGGSWRNRDDAGPRDVSLREMSRDGTREEPRRAGVEPEGSWRRSAPLMDKEDRRVSERRGFDNDERRGPPRDDRLGLPREDRRGIPNERRVGDKEDSWRRGDPPSRPEKREPGQPQEEDDGWTTVRY
jgi:hypothetical protein